MYAHLAQNEHNLFHNLNIILMLPSWWEKSYKQIHFFIEFKAGK